MHDCYPKKVVCKHYSVHIEYTHTHTHTPVDAGYAEVGGGVNRALGALPVDTLLHFYATVATLQQREKRNVNIECRLDNTDRKQLHDCTYIYAYTLHWRGKTINFLGVGPLLSFLSSSSRRKDVTYPTKLPAPSTSSVSTERKTYVNPCPALPCQPTCLVAFGCVYST